MSIDRKPQHFAGTCRLAIHRGYDFTALSCIGSYARIPRGGQLNTWHLEKKTDSESRIAFAGNNYGLTRKFEDWTKILLHDMYGHAVLL